MPVMMELIQPGEQLPMLKSILLMDSLEILPLGYNNFVFLNFSGRNDWTSTLAPGSNSYFYPSVGLSFVATDAFEALKNNNILTYAKVTLSNSTVYNDLEPYRLNETYTQTYIFPYGQCKRFRSE